MRLFELLQQEIPPQRIAKKIVEALGQANGQNLPKTLKNFLHSIADAIGLNYYVTLHEVTTSDFRCPEEAVNAFRFQYNSTIYDRYALLLELLCKAMDKADLLEPLLNVVEIFFEFCESFDHSSDDKFWEPFSLISLHLLKGLHKIRKAKSDSCPILNNKCHKLFEFAQNGLGHQDSHKIIFRGLCVLLEKDYPYFSSFDRNVFKFYIKCLEFDNSKTRAHLFMHMRAAVENSEVDSGPRERLIRFLTEPDIINAYCALSEQSSYNLLTSLLAFLQALLSQLNILECFSREQLHAIFRNALSPKPKIRSLAVGFYLPYMRRCFHDKVILRDIIDFYLSYAEEIHTLDGFIDSLWDQFPYLTLLDPYVRILKNPEWNLKTIIVTAQFAVRVYKKLYEEVKDSDDCAKRLSGFLLVLPKVLATVEDKWQAVGILLQCYSVTEHEVAMVTIKEFPIAADRFVKYALEFLKKLDKDVTVVQNVAHTMVQLMETFNMQEEMESFGRQVYRKYKEITSSDVRLSSEEVKTLQHTFVLLAASTDSAAVLNEEDVFELITDLRTRLMDTNSLQELATDHPGYNLDALAVTTYSGCLNVLSVMCAQMSADKSNIENTVLLKLINPFHEFLLKTLGSDNQVNVSLTLAEAAIRALCDLYITLNFKLQRTAYNVLVNSAETHVFTAAPADDLLRQLELQRNILHSLNMVHKFVAVPSPIIWKIVAYFGMAPELENELTELLDVLFEYNSEQFPNPKLFRYVIPVAIYNIFKRRPPLAKLRKALTAFKNYVETKLPDRTQRVMKLHIVLTIIDMIEKAMQITNVSQQQNRMILLSNMHIFLTEVYQTESNLVLTQSRRLQTHPLTSEERGTLQEFQERLSS